jgi:nitronate monooxygenase
MVRNQVTDILGLSIPVFQAPMAGGGDTAELVAAVSNAGGMGFIGAAYLTVEQIGERVQRIRQLTSRPFGINLFAPAPVPAAENPDVARAIERIRPYFQELGLPEPVAPAVPPNDFDERLAACLESGARVFSFAFGIPPARAIEAIKSRGMLLLGTATTVEEARSLVDAGADGVIAQGSEAGGHRSTFATEFEQGMVGSMALIPQIAAAVSVPVIASGGIMNGRGIAAALVLGASAVQMGTAFLTCEESGVPPAYKDAISAASEDQTRITRAFSGRPARGIANRLLRDYQDHTDSILPFPLQNNLTRPLRTEAVKRNRAEYLSLWAGQGLRMARRTTATELMQRLTAELSEAIDGLHENAT